MRTKIYIFIKKTRREHRS